MKWAALFFLLLVACGNDKPQKIKLTYFAEAIEGSEASASANYDDPEYGSTKEPTVVLPWTKDMHATEGDRVWVSLSVVPKSGSTVKVHLVIYKDDAKWREATKEASDSFEIALSGTL